MSIFGEKKALRTLEEGLFQLLRRVDVIESAAKIGKLEAAEVYDKTLRLMQRMAKRYEVDMRENAVDPPEDQNTESVVGIDPISAKILARRGSRRKAE